MKFKEERIKKLIMEEISKIIVNNEVKDPRIPKILTITSITLSKDLHYCHLYFTMIGNEADKNKSLSGLNSAAPFFQKLIGERLQLRFTPKMEFRYDEEMEKAYKLDKILADIAKEREAQIKE
ncbi:MAG TPA: 30S ribosome-binding factor RbfA [Spirochaetota bacterium]|nr:30S ribosome-binding factor RbfA [Spirochaetota bacterium]